MPRALTREERRSLPDLTLEVNPTDHIVNANPGQNPTRKIDEYTPAEVKLREGNERTDRTHAFARFVLQAAGKNGGVVPYAFRLPNGDPSSLDWGCVSYLKNAGEIELRTDAKGHVNAVVPRRELSRRYPEVEETEFESSAAADIVTIISDAAERLTTKAVLIDARIGQGQFRNELVRRWGGRCAVTNCNVPGLLRASHIRPWAKSTDLQRLDGENGLLLIANLDAAFDAYLVSFDDEGLLIKAARLKSIDALMIGATRKLRISPSATMNDNLVHHRAEMARLDRVAS